MSRERIEIAQELLEKYFYVDAMSVAQVAGEIGCSSMTVRKRLKEQGIELDPNIWYPGSSWKARKLLSQGTKLSPRQRSIVVGSVLGDSTLSRYKEHRHASLHFRQCIAHRGYVEWMREELLPFSLSVKIGVSTGTDFSFAYFYTTRHPEFDRFYDLFYPDGTKIVPDNIEDYVDELALAVWFMDDGLTGKNYSVLHTQGFTDAENRLLLGVLRDKFSIEGRFWRDPNGSDRHILAFVTRSGAHKRLHNIIDPILHSDFEYKKRWVEPKLGPSRGENHHLAKLTEDDVKEIRSFAARGVMQKVLAVKFNIGIPQVCSIIHRKAWKHIV